MILNSTNPLILAYVGDSVFNLLTRKKAILLKERLDSIDKRVTSLVRASAQARALGQIREFLNEEELDVVRRGRNAHSKHMHPKSASAMEYKAATALEALFGFLYLSGKEERANELFELIFEKWEEACQEQA